MRLITIAVLIMIFASMPLAGRSEEAMSPQIESHYITVTLDPDQNLLRAIDFIGLSGPVGGDFKFTLNKNLKIDNLLNNCEEMPYEMTAYMGEGLGEMGVSETLQQVTVHLPPDTTEFMITYNGVINDQVSPEKALAHIRGDFTSGIISPDGIYLSSETGWYPDTLNSMAQFEIVVFMPYGFTAVTQGDLLDRSDGLPTGQQNSTQSMSHWKSTTPTDGFIMVANKFFVTSHEIDGIKCSTYFFQDDPAMAKSFLDKLGEYIPAYQKLLGKYPYSRFDVVENFFSTGYGMPGFTLMGSGALRMPFATAEGSLAHELVHNYWGNGVFVDWDKGNWCEGLTTFSTNYYWNIISGKPEKAEDSRYLAMMRYSITVPVDKEYPIRQFRTKTTSIDDSIGYEKTCAFFIMLEQMLGDDTFFTCLRTFAADNMGKRAGWSDIEAAFEKVSGRELSGYFSTWLDKKGTPELKLEVKHATAEKEGMNILSMQVSQTGDPFFVHVPLLINTNRDDMNASVDIGNDPADLTMTMTEIPLSVTLDPHYYLFRRFPREEIPSCMNLTLGADHILVILPSGGETDMVETMTMGRGGPSKSQISVKDLMKQLADTITEEMPNAIAKYDNEVTDADVQNASILCLGSPGYNSYTARLAQDSQVLKLGPSVFSVQGVEYTGESQALLTSIRNPFNPNYDVTFYLGNSPQAMARAALIFHYGWDSYLIFEKGTAGQRGRWDMGKGSDFVSLQ
jgi:aminopeptidase N